MDKQPRPRPPAPHVAAGKAPRSSAPAPGDTWFLGRYRIVDTLGVGGMATVHLARVDGVGGFQKWIAIKRIHADLTEDDQFINMFLDEARIAASISHPNVAQVFELGQHEDTYWIAMEYLHGEPLREIMRVQDETGQLMSPELAARIVADAAEGLHAAHELRGKEGESLNLVHRDVTPHNLFVTYDGTVKVVDFGIAKVAGRLSSTMAGTLKGKIAYMSPEQLSGVGVDRRADIFSLGVVLWELSTGQRLFRCDSEAETLGRVRACIVPTPSMIVPSYAAELESIVMRALSKNPDGRQETARELSRALQQYLIHAKAFVGSDEITEHMTSLFADRLPQREAHLRWAAEVTNTKSLEQLAAAARRSRTPARTPGDAPPVTQREPRRMVVPTEATGSATNPVVSRRADDPLLQTRREKAFRAPVVVVPRPLKEPTNSDDDDEPATMIAGARHAAPRAAVNAAPAKTAPAQPDADDDDDDGDTVVVSEADMLAAMQQRDASKPAVGEDDDDDDDEAPTMALVPDKLPAAMRSAMAAPGLQRDRVQRAPVTPAARAPSVAQPTAPPATPQQPPPLGIPAPRVESAQRPLDPAAVLAQALAQAGGQPAAPPWLPPQATTPASAAVAPAPIGFDTSPARVQFPSHDFDVDALARQRSRRVVLVAAVVGGFFVLLGVLVLAWTLFRG